MKNCKKYWNNSLITGLLCLMTSLRMLACGPEWDPDNMHFRFFHDDEFVRESWDGLLYHPMSGFYVGNEGNEDRNINAWMDHFRDVKLKITDVSNVVYQMPLKVLETINWYVNGATSHTIPDPWNGNSLVRQWLKGKHQDAIPYLIYAKKCETQSMRNYYSWNENELDTEERKAELLAEGQTIIQNIESDFYRERYAYQLVRMAHYKGDYQSAVELFDQYLGEKKYPNYINYRALEQKAGALNGLDDPEAAYLFAKIYMQLPDRRETCLQSFFFTDQAHWDEAFALCQNDDERALFYLLRAFRYNGNEVAEMENIYALNPKSEFLPLLMVRQISMAEARALPTVVANAYPNQLSQDSLSRLTELCDLLLEKGLEKDRELYLTSKACLKFYEHKFQEARNLLTEIPIESEHRNQADLLDFVIRLSQIEEVTDSAEVHFYREWKRITSKHKCDDLQSFIQNVFSVHYMNQGEYGKAWLCHNDIADLERHLNLDVVNQIIELIDQGKENWTSFEWHLVEGKNRDDLIELKGSWYMQRNQLVEAIKWFEQLPKNYRKQSYGNNKYGNPAYFNNTLFAGNYKHHFDTNIIVQSDSFYKQIEFEHKSYNKLTLSQELLRLEQKAREGGKDAWLYYYALGNAWVNMSPYGFHRCVLYHHSENGHDYEYLQADSSYTFPDDFQCVFYYYHCLEAFYYYQPTIAESYHKKAAALAPNQELKARATFMAAKSELYQLFMSNQSRYSYGLRMEFEDMRDNDIRLNQYELMQSEFKSTKFYQEALRECSYFRKYLAG